MTKTKLALALIGAASAGGGLGVLLTKNYFKKKYEKEAQEAIQDARTTLIKRMHKDTSEGMDEPQLRSKSDLEGVSERKETETEMHEGFDEFGRQKDAPDFDPNGYRRYMDSIPEISKPDLEELVHKMRDTEPDDDGSEFGYDKEDSNFMGDFTKGENGAFEEDAPRLDEGQRDGDPNGKAPYIITEHEYIYGDRTFSKVCMTYYEKDKVLCDDDGSPVNINTFIGRKAITKLRNEDAVYVRNERFGVDIEVVAVDEWFNNPKPEYEEEDPYDDVSL